MIFPNYNQTSQSTLIPNGSPAATSLMDQRLYGSSCGAGGVSQSRDVGARGHGEARVDWVSK